MVAELLGEDRDLFGVAGLDGADEEFLNLMAGGIAHVDDVLMQISGGEAAAPHF